MSENLRIWDQIKTPPATALKPIAAGRLRGKTDISPQWRMQAMTELFGPCGDGWKYTIEKLWTEPGSGSQVVVFALVNLYWRESADGGWSEPVPGIGGNMLIEQESAGPHTSDEAYKMAVTDALSVAMKALGMAADVYLGQADSSKYQRSGGQQNQGDGSGGDGKVYPASEKQVKYLFAVSKEKGKQETVQAAVHDIKEKHGLIPGPWASKQIERLLALPDVAPEERAAPAPAGEYRDVQGSSPDDDDIPF